MKKVFSGQIINQSFKSAWIWWLIFVFVISLNLFAFSSEAGTDDNGMALLTEFVDTGIRWNGVVFVLIFAILFANIFITNEVDRGTLAITLNTPTTRSKILISKMLVFIFFTITISIATGITGSVAALMFGAKFAYAKWWTIIAFWSLYSFTVGGIAFFISCWFNKSRYAMATSALILGAFFIFSMLAGMENFEFCKYFTLQTLFDMTAVLEGQSVLWQMIVLPIIAIPFYVFGLLKFVKKDLHL